MLNRALGSFHESWYLRPFIGLSAVFTKNRAKATAGRIRVNLWQLTDAGEVPCAHPPRPCNLDAYRIFGHSPRSSTQNAETLAMTEVPFHMDFHIYCFFWIVLAYLRLAKIVQPKCVLTRSGRAFQ
jgi:hypothetical protein